MTDMNNPTTYTELQTNDPTRAQAFYSGLFGWRAEIEETPLGPYTAFEGQLVGITAPRGGVPAGWVPYIGVADAKRSTAQALELGATILRDCVSIPAGTFSVLRDPTGGIFGVFQKA
jgi:uncharacterized protein